MRECATVYEARENWQMRYCIWWIQGVNGGSCLKTFHRIQQHTVFTAKSKSAGCGIKYGASCKKDANKYRAQGESKLRDHWFPECENSSGKWGRWNWRWEKTKGRKRHIVVEVLGCLLSVAVHAANIHDTKGGMFVAKRAHGRYGQNFSFSHLAQTLMNTAPNTGR